MTLKYYIENATLNEAPARVELKQIGQDVTNPTFQGINDANSRLTSAKLLLEKCVQKIKGTSLVTPGVFFIYRGVAIGGIQRQLGGFASKPLTVKYKSIDPTLLGEDDALKRLTGLIPILKKLGKGGQASDETTISPDRDTQRAYRIVQVNEEVGNEKKYLYCAPSTRSLTWEPPIPPPTNKTLCTFLGNIKAPYLADWDLVLVGVTKRTDRKGDIFKVPPPNAERMGSIIPNWVDKGIKELSNPTTSSYNHVTQHGPESLYCGNDITEEKEFLVVCNYGQNDIKHEIIKNDTPDIVGATPWKKTQNFVATRLSDYIEYKFSQFTGTIVQLTPEQINQEIEQLNARISQ